MIERLTHIGESQPKGKVVELLNISTEDGVEFGPWVRTLEALRVLTEKVDELEPNVKGVEVLEGLSFPLFNSK